MQALRNVVSLCALGFTAAALSAGCSDGEGAKPLGGGAAPSTGGGGSTANPAGGSGGSAQGGSTSPTAGTGGTPQTSGGSGGTPPTTGGGGAGGTGGTPPTTGGGGAGGTGGSAGGTGGAGGSGGTTGGGGSGGTGGAGVGFPANCPAPTGTHSTMALTRSCWNTAASDCAASANNMNPPKQAIDTDATLMTRFSTGKKQLTGNFTFEVDLGATVMINGISAASMNMDYAPSLMVSVSTDGTNFTNVACGPGATTTDFSFAAVAAKIVRLTQYGTIDKWWSIHDFNVYGAPGATDTCGGGAGTPTDTCTTPHTTDQE